MRSHRAVHIDILADLPDLVFPLLNLALKPSEKRSRLINNALSVFALGRSSQYLDEVFSENFFDLLLLFLV